MKLPPVTVRCPCGTEIDIPISATLTSDDDRQYLALAPDYADLWAHSWTHDTTVNYDFGVPHD